jgi:hypothetical protein
MTHFLAFVGFTVVRPCVQTFSSLSTNFGFSLGMSKAGDTVVIGSPDEQKAYVYTKSPSTGLLTQVSGSWRDDDDDDEEKEEGDDFGDDDAC